MAITALNTAASGMYANRFRTDVTANNVANVNTDNFRASTVQTTDAAYINDIGRGTRVAATYQPPMPGTYTPAAANGAAPARPTGTQTAGAVQPPQGTTQTSNVDLARERINQMSAQNAYSVNASAFRTADQMTQTLLNTVR